MPGNTEKIDRFNQIVKGAVLPSMAVVESIATRGRSPGTGVLSAVKTMDEWERRRRAEKAAAEKAALEKQIRTFQLGELKSKTDTAKEQAALRANLKKQLSLTKNPAEREKILKQYHEQTDPGAALSYARQERIQAQKEQAAAEKIEREKKAAAEKLKREDAEIEREERRHREKMDRLDKAELRNLESADRKEAREVIKQRQSLRKEIAVNPSVKKFHETDSSFSKMETVWNERKDKLDINSNVRKKRAAIDQALITLYNKMLDPTSVVRESEYARTPENVPTVNRVVGYVEQIGEGGAGITDADRQEIIDVATQLYESGKKRYVELLTPYVKDAQESGYQLDRVFSPRDLNILGYMKDEIEEQKAERVKNQDQIAQEIFQGSQMKSDLDLIDELMGK